MKRIEIKLTADQVRQLRPVEHVLEQHRGTGVSTIGQVMFYDGRTVLVIGVLTAELTAKVQAVTMAVDENVRLLDLPAGEDA